LIRLRRTSLSEKQEYLTLTRSGVSDLAKLQLELILADGSTWPQKGKFSFADRQVSPSTGAIQLTGLFPNPGNRLRPGQYGMVRAAIGTTAARCSFRSALSLNSRARIRSPW